MLSIQSLISYKPRKFAEYKSMRQPGIYSGISGRSRPHSLPLARIKKIMKLSGEDVKMITGEAPIVFSKACELFIEELTLRSWMVTLQGKRKTLHREDVANAIFTTDIFDFLAEMVSNEPKVIVAGVGESYEAVEEPEGEP